MKRRFILLAAVLVMSLSAFVFASGTGITFSTDSYYTSENELSVIPKTYEATVMLPNTIASSERGGVILGNYKDSGTVCVSFEVYSNGQPRLYIVDGINTAISVVFDEVSLYTGNKTHVAITEDNGTYSCYINGELVQSISGTSPDYSAVVSNPVVLGGDLRSGNARYFLGTIYDVAFFDDVRTAEEIAEDYAEMTYTDVNLMAAYDLSLDESGNEPDSLSDKSSNGFNMTYSLKQSTDDTETDETSGLSFTAGNYYTTSKNVTSFPKTFEATVYMPVDTETSVNGVIFGNSGDAAVNCAAFHVTPSGHPGFYLRGIGTSESLGVEFGDVNLYNGEKTHIAVTIANGVYKCYVNGVHAQTVNGAAFADFSLNIESPMILGGDLRIGNGQYFRGKVFDIALFDDVRTADEIAADYILVDNNDANLIAAYNTDISKDSTHPLVISDMSENNNTLVSSGGGLDFTADQYYVSQNNLTVFPKTYEATIYFPEDMTTSNAGVIFGNSGDTSVNCTSFQIFADGHPGFYIRGIDGEQSLGVKFSDVSVYNGKKTHLAVTVGNGVYKCYVDGVLAQTVHGGAFPAFNVEFDSKVFIGSDFTDGNVQYFRGNAYDLALFSDIRTAEEIASDFAGVDTDTDGLIGAYDLSYDNNARRPASLSNKSTNGFDFDLLTPWIYEKDPVTDYDYSMAVIGDIQTLTYYYPDKLHHVFDWVTENAEEKKTAHAFVLGDITDKDLDSEYELAKPLIQQMDSAFPYTLIRGNHDSKAQYNKYFTYEEFGTQNGGSYDGTMLNTYQFFEVGDTKFMSLALDIGAGDAVLDWASEVIDANPDTNVIVSTHIYMNSDGSLMTEGVEMNPVTWYGGEKYADETWNDFLSQHENIVLVLCGHISTDEIVVRQDEGVHGNVVTQMLVDPQATDKTVGACGLVAMLYFKNDGKTVEVEYYSTVNEAYFLEENQFTFEIDLVGEIDKVTMGEIALLDASKNEIEEIPDTSFYAKVPVTNNSFDGEISVVIASYDADGRMLDTDFLCADPDKGQTFSFGAQINNKDGKVAKVKAFAFSDIFGFSPLCESKETVK